MKKIVPFIILCLIEFISYGQPPTTIASKTFGCEQILRGNDIENILTAGAVDRVILKCSPKGAGNIQEVASGKKKDQNYFEKEHNIVWIRFTAKSSGKLSFRIKPKAADDDYDFLLFKETRKFSSKSVQKRVNKPIRANISRNNIADKGVTGLDFSSKSTHTVSGVNNNFSKVVAVVKDENYILAIDNVYGKGTGAIIYFDYYLTKKISGIVVNDKKSQFLNAEVNWNDARTGKTLATTKTDSLVGTFEIEVPYLENKPKQKYIIGTYSHGYFFKEKEFTVEEIKAHASLPINIIMPKLKKGLRNPLQSMNFHGNLSTFLPSAFPSLGNLKKLMKRNKSLMILIEGHTNGCNGQIVDPQKLSEDRALAVKSYLVDKGIDANRIKTVGLNCQHMIFPIPRNEKESSLNRRVEILITEYEE